MIFSYQHSAISLKNHIFHSKTESSIVIKKPKERAKVSTPKRAAEATQCCGEIEVTFSQSGVNANWNPSFESILDLAEENGLSPDYSCRSGICHTCMCKLEEGEVEYILEPLDPPEDGSVLICCSKPRNNVVVDL